MIPDFVINQYSLLGNFVRVKYVIYVQKCEKFMLASFPLLPAAILLMFVWACALEIAYRGLLVHFLHK